MSWSLVYVHYVGLAAFSCSFYHLGVGEVSLSCENGSGSGFSLVVFCDHIVQFKSGFLANSRVLWVAVVRVSPQSICHNNLPIWSCFCPSKLLFKCSLTNCMMIWPCFQCSVLWLYCDVVGLELGVVALCDVSVTVRAICPSYGK
ncbi:hypothetical protein SAY87_023258 [Trapa incisa]|uniref:Uncharacterized protein n=1 Tax=Trapa incisa TaxID=236973 RepID=A0AAN7Q603_9MYRT|nr:hypothetical protein SAY87_023258 [Trapa incisa]